MYSLNKLLYKLLPLSESESHLPTHLLQLINLFYPYTNQSKTKWITFQFEGLNNQMDIGERLIEHGTLAKIKRESILQSKKLDKGNPMLYKRKFKDLLLGFSFNNVRAAPWENQQSA